MTTYLIRWILLMLMIGIVIGIIATICVAVILAKRQEKKDAEVQTYWRDKVLNDFMKGAGK